MPFTYQLHEEAYHEFIEAYEWYEIREPGLGKRFMGAVENCLNKISLNPELHTKVYRNFRQAEVPYFPFTVVYEFYPKRAFIHIAAIHHTKRNPKGKFRR
ncbi:MAG: type II toxin-antitoxin system RelE/ParE family toxin [Flavipsychrobacter sp.]